MTEIPLFKVLMAQDADDAVIEVLRSGHVAQGPRVEAFEAQLAAELEVPVEHLVTVNSGTAALHLAYHLAGIREGDVVIATPMTCAATITPLVHMGAEIVWADVDPVTGNIDPVSVANLLDVYDNRAGAGWLRAIVAVDWAGTPASYDHLRAMTHVPIIEDAAHAMFAERHSATPIAKQAIADGITVCFSLQAIKHLTTGDGGAIVFPTVDLAERARRLRWFGLDRRSSQDFRCAQDIEEAGWKYHMNDIAAAIGLGNLAAARKAVGLHRRHAAMYLEAFANLTPRVLVPPWHPGSSYWIYTLLVEDRADFQRHLADRGIATSQVHRRNDHHSAFPRAARPLPGLEQFSAHQVSIPVGWWLDDSDIARVIAAVRSWAA